MRSAIWAFMALFGLLATLSVVQAAVPAIFSLNTNIGDATQADIAVDAFGNSYYLSYSQAADFNTITPIHPDGTKFTGCTDPTVLKTNFNTLLADSRPAGFTIVADRNFPSSPNTASWIFITACNGAAPVRCDLIRVPLANTATAAGANCPINWAGATNIGQVQGSTLVGGVATNFDCSRYASTVVAMASNPVTGALYIGCPSGGVSYIVQTQNMQVAGGVFQGTYASLAPASNIVYRIPSASAVIGSIAIDSYGSLWVVDTARSMVFAARPFTTALDFPSSISSNVGLQSVWSRATSTNKYLSVAADRSGNVYFSTYQPASDNVNVWSGNVVTFPGIALINPPATSTVPRAWSYFSTGSTFDSASTDPAGGILAYDPYRGRLIMNGRMGWYNMPLYTVQFDFTTAPTTLLDGTGAVCGTESPTCIRVPVMTSNVAASFSLRIAAPSWPATVASLPFSPNFLISTSGVSANAASPFPTSITQAVFQNTGASAAATYAQIGTTGSFLFSWTTGVTVTSTGGYAGPMTLSPAYTGATNDVSFLFTSLPSTTIVVQGSITAVAQASNTFPLSSSTTLLAGVPTRYQLTLNPAPSAQCTTPTFTFTNSADNIYSSPPAAAPAAGATLVVSFTGVNAPVTYVTNVVSAVTWAGAFGGVGTGCTLSYGAARVPLYAISMTTTARPAISITPIIQLISSTPVTNALFDVRMIPGPSATLGANMAVGFRSGVNPATATLSTSGACSGDFTPTSGAIAAATCTTGATSCALTGNSFTPNTATCALAASTSAAIVADVAIPAGLLATGNLNYWYWNAATGAPAQVPTTAATINVYTVTAPLSVRMKWAAAVPTTQIVAPNGILGPYTIDYTGSPVSVSFTTPFGGSFFVLPAGTSISNYPTATSAWSTGSFNVGTGSLVFYRAPAVASATMLGAAAFDITIVTPTGVTYDPTGTVVAIQIRLVSSLTTTSTPRNANLINLVPNSINIWAGTTARTRNTVTLSWGSGLLNANNVITVYGTSDTALSTVSFAAVGAVPAVPGTAVTTTPAAPNDNNANVIANVCNPGNCASITFGSIGTPVAAGTSSVTFLVAGGKPGEKISFWLKVTGGDSAFFGFPFIPVGVNFGQVFINSLPTQLSVNVPTFFGVTVEPAAPAATNLVIADSSTGNVGTFQFCSDITCGTNQPGATYNLANMNGAYAATTTVIQYIPPFPQACVGGLANQYPCALGTIPTFTSDLDPTYAFDWAPTLVSRLNVQNNAGKFKLTVGGNPALQGSIAITFVNYDAANDAVNPPIGVNTGATTFTYPLSNTADMSALPLPMVNGKPSLNFLAGVRYAIGVTMYPAPDATASPTLTVAYNEDNLAAPITGSTFSLNRADATAPAPINGAPALNTTVNVFGASPLDFTNNRVDNALKSLTPAVNAADVMCPANSQVGGKCFVGFFWWNVPAVTSGPAANNPRLTFTVAGTGVANYPTQTQTVKISGWCGPSSNLRDPLQPTHYATPTTIATQCTPALPAATFLNVFQDWRDLVTPGSPWSQPLFYPTATPFAAGTTTWTPPTGAPAAAGAFVPVGTAGTWMQVFRSATENSALVVGMANLVYSVTTANTATDRTTLIPTLSPAYVQIRHISPIVGAYTVKVANAAFAAGGCDIPAVGYIGDSAASRLPSVSATSNNFAQVCVFPPRAGNGPAFALTVSDGLTVDTNTFDVAGVGAGLVVGAATTAFTAGVSGPATAFLNAGAATKAGLTLTMAAGVIAYNGFNFNWNLANAATNIAEFRLCAAPAAGAEAAAYTAGVLSTICAPNAYPAFPAGTTALPAIQYRQVATTASSTAVTYAVNRVPISVTMKLTARGMAAGADFNLAGVSTFEYVVGETYAIELRTAASLSSPAVAGLTVTLNDMCGVLTYPGGGAAPTPAASPVAVPARGQFSSQVLFFSPGETTKTFFYTPREICAPVTVGGVTTNWGTIISASVCTDATNAQCADGAATRFVNPTSVYVSTFGAIRVDNVPSYLPSGVATPSPITVTLNPPILPAGAVSPVISTLAIPDLRVTLSDRAPAGGVIGNGDSAGGSFILGQNTGASATLNFATAGVRQSASVSYVAPPNSFFIENAVVSGGANYFGVSTGISAVVSGTGAPHYRIVGAPSNVYNSLATIATAASAALSATNKDLWAAATNSAATFNLRIVPEAVAAASIEGVYFNVVAGAALAQSTAQSLATVSDNISQFVGNSNVQPGQANNAINFNLPFVSGVPFGYFAAVPFNMSAVVVNVATTANTIYVNNNGWPNAKSAGGSLGGYILPNALSGYVSPVFFLTPGLNTFLVAAPAGSVADAFAFNAPAGAQTLNPGANGDGIVYRFTIARDTITNFGLFVSANGYGTLPWSANLPRLQPQYVAGSTASLLAVGPGAGAAQTTFTANVENGVQSVGILAQFYGALKARVSSNMNEFGQVLVNIPNNRLVDFPLVAPTNLPGITSSTTSITLLGGGLGPITINVVRPGKSLLFGSQFVSGGTTIASNIVDTPTGPCVARTATSFGLAVYPSSRASANGLTIKGTYATAQAPATAVPIQQAATSATTTWDIVPGVNYVSYATLTATAIPVSALPVTLNLRAVYAADAASEFTALNNYPLNLCPQ